MTFSSSALFTHRHKYKTKDPAWASSCSQSHKELICVRRVKPFVKSSSCSFQHPATRPARLHKARMQFVSLGLLTSVFTAASPSHFCRAVGLCGGVWIKKNADNKISACLDMSSRFIIIIIIFIIRETELVLY